MSRNLHLPPILATICNNFSPAVLDMAECPSCNGDGNIRDREDPAAFPRCPSCHGEGKLPAEALLMDQTLRTVENLLSAGAKREAALRGQQLLCKRNKWPHFAPSTGTCWHCKGDMVAGREQEWATTLITGCRLCGESYCD